MSKFNKKILIVGGSGGIGVKFTEFFLKKNIPIISTHNKNKDVTKGTIFLDITKQEETIKTITAINPDIVIHLSALTNVDLCETNKKLAYKINVEGTVNVIKSCEKNQSKLIYISSSFVFDGTKQEFYEEDKPNPINYYGKTKYTAEEKIRESDLDFLILRTDQPYCWIKPGQKINSVIRMLNALRKNEEITEITDWYNNPTYVPEFVDVTYQLINTKNSGIFHLVGSDYVNRFEWAKIVAKQFAINTDLVKPISAKSLKLPAKRGNVNLNNRKIFNKIGHHMMGVDEGIIKMKNEL